MKNTKIKFSTLINILKDFVELEKTICKNESFKEMQKNNISSLTSFFYNQNYWEEHFYNIKEIFELGIRFAEIIHKNSVSSSNFIKEMIDSFYFRLEQNYNFVHIKLFLENEFNLKLSNANTREVIKYLRILKIAEEHNNDYKTILNNNYYFNSYLLQQTSIKKNIFYKNVFLAIYGKFKENYLVKKILLLKFLGYQDSTIAVRLKMNSIEIKEIILEFINNDDVNTYENLFIKFFKNTNINYKTFSKYIDMTWESYNYIHLKSGSKKANELGGFEDFKNWLETEGINIRTNKYFNINEWIENVKNKAYSFSKHIECLELKIENKTLEEIGTKLQITRENVRQIIKGVIEHVPYLEEMKFLHLYDKYNLTESIYTKLTNLPKESFYFSSLISKVSKNDKEDEINLLNEDFISEEIRDKIIKNSNKISVDGELLENKRTSICIQILKKEQSSLHISNIKKIFNRDYKESSINPWESRTIANALTQSKFVLATPNFSFRHFNISSIYEDFKIEINEMLSNLKGVYSANYFMENNKDLIDKMGIINEYELHNFLKKTISIEGVTFNRMPTIFFQYNSRKDFYIDILRNLTPIHYKNYCLFLSENYGHKIQNLYSNVKNEVEDYYSNEMLSMEIETIPPILLTEEFLDNFKDKIILKIKDLEEFFLNNEINIKYLNDFNLKKLGFNLNKNYAIKKDTTIVKEINKILNQKGKYNNYFSEYSKIDGKEVLSKELRNFDVIQLDKDSFVSIDFFTERTKISKHTLLNELSVISNHLINKDILDLDKIKKELTNLSIFNGALNDFCLNKLIYYQKNIKTNWYSNFCLFSHIKNNIDINLVIESIITSSNFIYEDDLIIVLQNKIGKTISNNWLQKRNENLSNIFYCKEIKKYYKDKNTYLNEIYPKD